MPKYEKIKKVYFPLNIYKTERTVSIATDGRKVLGGIGNEALDIGLWIEEKIADGTISVTFPSLDALIQLTGLPEGSVNLGTFTGSIITDNSTIKSALQQLETYIQSSVGYTDEQAQDAVGNILTDSSTINFAYSDVSNIITADIITNSVVFDKIQQISTNTLLGRYDSGTGNVQLITIGTGLELDGDTLNVSFVPGSGTVTSVGIDAPSSVFDIFGSPVTDVGTLTLEFKEQSPNLVFASPDLATGVPTFRALTIADIPNITSSKITNFNESVDDRVASLLIAGTNITLTYNDVANTLTIAASGTSYTNEDAQDAIGNILIDSDTINFTYNDSTPSITGTVITQLSVTSDSSGVKLLGDVASPGNNMYYGTDGSGTKGFFAISGGSLPAGTSTQTLRYNSSNVLVANSTITNDGTNVGVGGAPFSPYRLYVNGGVRAAGVLQSRGSGTMGSATTVSEVRLDNIVSGVEWYLHSSNDGELLIGLSSLTPELKIDTSSDVIVANKLSVGDTSPVPETLIGIDSTGYIGEITLGAGLLLEDGELSAPTGSLPTGTGPGSFLYWDGAEWLETFPIKDSQIVSSGNTVSLPHIPISDLPIDVYLNGLLKEDGVDYTIASNVITFLLITFTTNDKITTKYYI